MFCIYKDPMRIPDIDGFDEGSSSDNDISNKVSFTIPQMLRFYHVYIVNFSSVPFKILSIQTYYLRRRKQYTLQLHYNAAPTWLPNIFIEYNMCENASRRSRFIQCKL